MKLENKVAVITGAGSGMGRSMAYRYAQEGAKVVAADIKLDGVESLMPEVADFPGQVTGFQVDVSSCEQVEAMLDFAVSTYGGLDIVVNNAGIMDGMVPVGEVEDSMWNRVLDINLNGVMFSCRHAIKIMTERGKGGSIINTASVGGLQGCRAGAAYTASKFAVVGLTRNIGYMYATKGIRCNAICPGGIETNIGVGLRAPSEFGMEQATKGVALSPRFGKPDEVARVAVFLATDDASFVNGTTVTVDGGWTAF